MSRSNSRRAPILLVAVLGLALTVPTGGTHAQTEAVPVAVDRHSAMALDAMALWNPAPALYVNSGYDIDEGILLWNAQPIEASALFTFGHVLHVPGFPDLTDSTGYRGLIGQYRAAFPDLVMTVDDVIADGNKVVVLWTMEGTHTGNFGEIAATGNPFKIAGVSIFRTTNGNVAETWFMPDGLGLLDQIVIDPSA